MSRTTKTKVIVLKKCRNAGTFKCNRCTRQGECQWTGIDITSDTNMIYVNHQGAYLLMLRVLSNIKKDYHRGNKHQRCLIDKYLYSKSFYLMCEIISLNIHYTRRAITTVLKGDILDNKAERGINAALDHKGIRDLIADDPEHTVNLNISDDDNSEDDDLQGMPLTNLQQISSDPEKDYDFDDLADVISEEFS